MIFEIFLKNLMKEEVFRNDRREHVFRYLFFKCAFKLKTTRCNKFLKGKRVLLIYLFYCVCCAVKVTHDVNVMKSV